VDESRFYELIEAARPGDAAQDLSADADELRTVLEPLSDEELTAFAARFDHELVRLNRWPIWAAGYVADGGMSDDGFHYFRAWLIGKGSAAVETALRDPDGLADFLNDDEELDNEELEYVAVELLESRELPEPDTTDLPDAEPEGEPFDERTVEEDFPRIAAWAEGA
jgi:hypothetical protein